MYKSLTEFKDIYTAYRRTARGKHNKDEVIKYENNLHMQLWWLKERIDHRAFQHLLCDKVLMPYFEPRLIYDNAACRVGKGTHFAMDRLIKEKLRIKHYIRYMDDGVMVHPDKEFLKKVLVAMRELVEEDGLSFNEKTQIFPISQGVDFLGFHYYLTDTGKVIKKLRTSNKRRFKRRMKSFQKKYRNGEMTFQEITQSVASYNGHLKHGHTWKLKKHIYGKTIFTKAREDSDEKNEIKAEERYGETSYSHYGNRTPADDAK